MISQGRHEIKHIFNFFEPAKYAVVTVQTGGTTASYTDAKHPSS